MPTPVEHYETAERLLAAAREATNQPDQDAALKAAQVHAHLATVPWAMDDRGDTAAVEDLSAGDVVALITVGEELLRWSRSATVVPVVGCGPEQAEGWVSGQTEAKAAVEALLEPLVDLFASLDGE